MIPQILGNLHNPELRRISLKDCPHSQNLDPVWKAAQRDWEARCCRARAWFSGVGLTTTIYRGVGLSIAIYYEYFLLQFTSTVTTCNYDLLASRIQGLAVTV